MADLRQPPFGKRLLVAQVDRIARSTPNKVYASYPKSRDFSKGFRDVTYKELANAVNRGALWLEKTLGGKSNNFETVAYMGDGDLRYFIFILASHKTGYKLLLPSPRNSLEGQINLIDKTECRTVLRSDTICINDILTKRHLQSFVVPELDELLDAKLVAHVPYERTFEQAEADPYAVYHSSGSTGLPKPVISPQGAACTVDALNLVPPLDGKEVSYLYFAKLCPRFFSSLPFFHAAGVVLGLCQPVYFGNTVVFGHPSRATNAEVVDEIIEHGHIEGILLPPSILEEMTKTESSLERISRLSMMLVATGPLSTQAGKITSQKTFLAICAGSTEAHLWVTHAPDPEDWQYFMIGEDAAGIEMRPDTDQKLFEMVYVRRPECDHLQAIFKTFRDLDEYSTGDMFAPHPTKAHLWRYVGRQDNMIVLSNGEKVQPGPIQDTLLGHKAIREALIVGHGKFQLAAILELMQYPKNNEEARKLMDDIWPIVEEANYHSPSHGRLLRQFVIFASPDKPFVRVGKGSLSRPSTISLYENEIEAIFTKGESGMAVDVGMLDMSTDVALQRSVQSACQRVLGREVQNLDTDFFMAGADSLAALTLAATLKRSLRMNMPLQANKINSRLIYRNPTVRQLSSAIMTLAKSSSDSISNAEIDIDGIVKSLFERVANNDCLETRNGSTSASGTAVLLTGSTGSLGSYILNQLLSDKTISRIYCLNRATDGELKQRDSSKSRNLLTDFRHVTFVQGDLSKDDFGLSSHQYQTMTNEVKYIIHAQWPVNFSTGIGTFEPHIRGVANLALFSLQAPSRPLICFLSSIASIENWNARYGLTEVSEQSHDDTTLASSGYGLSKLAASTILDQASKKGVRSLVLRIGQIAGPSDRNMKGIWPKHEWLPSLLASSKFLGLIPESLNGAENVDWIPVDLVAQIVCQLAAAEDASGYAHVVSPKLTTWKETILLAVQDFFQGELHVVSFNEWVARLRESAVDIRTEDVQHNPAVKLVEFYEDLANGKALPRLATSRAQEMSKTLQQCNPISKEDVLRWLAGWNF